MVSWSSQVLSAPALSQTRFVNLDILESVFKPGSAVYLNELLFTAGQKELQRARSAERPNFSRPA
jgi:hypothetical protein